MVSYKLSKQIADQVEGMLVLPPITVGYSGHYDSFPFTLTLSYDTTTQVIYDIVESCIRQGIDHIFLMNGHDGNIAPIEVASRKIKEVYPQAQIAALTQWWVAAGDLLPKDTFEVWAAWATPAKVKPLSLIISSETGVSRSWQHLSFLTFRNIWTSNGTSPS